MRIDKLWIKNFRKIKELTVEFPRGLSIVVGENNVGKTAIIDALRLFTFPSRDFSSVKLNEDDFQKEHRSEPIEMACTFSDLNVEEEARFLECLVRLADGKFVAKINLRAEFNPDTERVNYDWWGGETEGGQLPRNLFDYITSVYLPPLRDPEDGLKPARYSQVARLIKKLTPENEEVAFEAIVEKANSDVKELPSVKKAVDEINSQLLSVAGEELAQTVELIFNDPEFSRIVGGLFPETEGLPIGLNGLGYNNLIFTAATLSTLQKSDQFSFRSILIEEPEAHLHPQLQVLLLDYLSKASEKEGAADVQIIVTSHSPVLASQAPVDTIISLHEIADEKVKAVTVAKLPFDPVTKKKLRRYLSATRGELFFARKILLVEGIGEALLLPIFARIAGGSLLKSAVTIVNAAGINFDAFLPLFGAGGVETPVAILTDGDAKAIGGAKSAASQILKAKQGQIPQLRVELSERSFEHELARRPELLPHMVAGFKVLHPIIGVELATSLNAINGNDAKANYFYEVFIEKEVSKGRFAQELAQVLEDAHKAAPIPKSSIPAYIQAALVHLGVTKNDAPQAAAA